MAVSLFSVSFVDAQGVFQVSRLFSSVRAARKWGAWLAKQSYCREVVLHCGGPGGERLN